MARSLLRLYSEPEATTARTQCVTVDGDRVTLPLGDLMPLLLDAVRGQRTWLQDFEEETLTIPSDLYDVLMAYQYFRPSA